VEEGKHAACVICEREVGHITTALEVEEAITCKIDCILHIHAKCSQLGLERQECRQIKWSILFSEVKAVSVYDWCGSLFQVGVVGCWCLLFTIESGSTQFDVGWILIVTLENFRAHKKTFMRVRNENWVTFSVYEMLGSNAKNISCDLISYEGWVWVVIAAKEGKSSWII